MLVIWFQKENVNSVRASIVDRHSTMVKIWERRNHIIENTISLQDFNCYADSLFQLWRYMSEATSFQAIYVLIWHLNTSQDYWCGYRYHWEQTWISVNSSIWIFDKIKLLIFLIVLSKDFDVHFSLFQEYDKFSRFWFHPWKDLCYSWKKTQHKFSLIPPEW